MPIRTIGLLPEIFRTTPNEKFVNATVEQLTSEPNLKRVNGYIGRQFTPLHNAETDNYIAETTSARSNYQLEPSVVVPDIDGKPQFVGHYSDMLNKIRYYGGDTSNHSRLFANEHYSYNSRIDYDKFINFSQYYWLPDGPVAAKIFGSTIPVTDTIDVTRIGSSEIVSEGVGSYQFSSVGTQPNPILILARGGSYDFAVDQPGNPFWIQTHPGTDGTQALQPNFSTREIFGITNNGDDHGTITFNVPESDAQDFYTNMTSTTNVNLAASGITYADLQGHTLTQFLAQHNGIDGNVDIEGKTFVFIDNSILISDWTATETYDHTLGYGTEFATGITVPEINRNGVWQLHLEWNATVNDYIIHLTANTILSQNEKFIILEGDQYNDREFYTDLNDQLVIVPYITVLQDTFYYQDANDSNLVGIIKLVDVGETFVIDVENDILVKSTYTSPNGVVFTNGLKVIFDEHVTPTEFQNKSYYVEGVGNKIKLVDIDLFLTPESYIINNLTSYDTDSYDSTGFEGSENSPVTKDYITINRGSIDNNAWSRGNRWFHIDVMKQIAKYENVEINDDQSNRATRPIIEFDADLKLFNYGKVATEPVDIFDTIETDAYSNFEGLPIEEDIGGILTPLRLDGILLEEGMRIIFSVDEDPAVRLVVHTLELVDLNNDGILTVHLVPDPTTLENDVSLLVQDGLNQRANMYHLLNDVWTLSQPKTKVNQSPLFDVFTADGASLSDNQFENSSFEGTKIFSYAIGTGIDDTVLGFPLQYKNFSNVGDIVFENNFDKDIFSYTVETNTIENQINIGFLHKTVDMTSFNILNIWDKTDEESFQPQLISYVNNNTNYYEIDILPEDEMTVKYYKVFVDNKELDRNEFHFEELNTKQHIVIDVDITDNNKIDIQINSKDVSTLGWYQIPSNLENNAQNTVFTDLTLGQLRNHINAAFNNSLKVTGTFPGTNNLRDNPNALLTGGDILQHSAGIPYANMFLLDERSNFVDSVIHAQQEYVRFKYKFVDLAGRMELDLNNIPGAVDSIISFINDVKTKDFPWYTSDMIPYGSDVVETEYEVIQLVDKDYELVTLFDNTQLSNKSALVYVNGIQLANLRDFVYNSDRPYITITGYDLQIGDTIKLVEYDNTDGCWVPETPSKMGMYPTFIPEIFVDDTYVTNPTMIRGHDGSLIPIFGDYRDDLILELETRIYNNIKIVYDDARFSINSIKPGKFRDNEFSLTEYNSAISKMFFKFAGENKLEYRDNNYFDSNNSFTYNFRKFASKVDSEPLNGSWKAVYNHHYDTIRPNTSPWEMLGFSIKPDWWEGEYGPGPYTSGNLVLWDDLSEGRIKGGPRAGIDTKYARPNLRDIIPCDKQGRLKAPTEFLTSGTHIKYANEEFIAGEEGPIESAWRASSQFPYAMQVVLALLKPAKYFGLYADVKNYNYDTTIGQYLQGDTNQRLTQFDLKINGELDDDDGTFIKAAGYLNWIADYIKTDNVSPTTYLGNMLTNFDIQLAYKVAGFTDKKFLKIVAEQSSPSSNTSSIIMPDEDYHIKLNHTAPLIRVSYSAVIVQQTQNGYKVDGYNLGNPHFTILPSIQNSNTTKLKVLDEAVVVYKNHSNQPVSVPYGYEFKTRASLVDFLIAYGRFLERQGFLFNEFDNTISEVKNWTMSAKEFLYWSQQGWGEDAVMVLNPLSNKIHINTPGAVVGEIKQTTPNSITDQNFRPVKLTNFSVKRLDNEFELEIIDGSAIGFLEFPLIQIEHILVFNNITVFNDIIYQSELGNRQIRLKLVGFISNQWNGNLQPGGYIFNDDNVSEWQQSTDYKRGQIIKYKSNYYVASSNLVGSTEFDYDSWESSDFNKTSTGMIPNFSNKSGLPDTYYDVDNVNLESDSDLFGKGLIGYRNRDYFHELGLDDTSQIKFYQGMINEKGTSRSIEALTRAQLNDDNADIQMYEEWALRVGEYGAIDSTQLVEVILPEGEITSNPALIVFKNQGDEETSDALNVYPHKVYQGPNNFDKNLFLLEEDQKGLDDTIKTAGPPKLSEATYTLYTIDDLKTLDKHIKTTGDGQSIWVASDTNNDWNYYRIASTHVDINNVTLSEDQLTLRIDTNKAHDLDNSDRVLIRNVDTLVDGWYNVDNVIDLNTFQIKSNTENDYADFEPISTVGQLFKLKSLRFANASQMSAMDIDIKDNETVYIDDIDGLKNWAVYEKLIAWNFDSRIVPRLLEEDSDYGSSVAASLNGQFLYSGSPKGHAGIGYVDIRVSTQSGTWDQLSVLSPDSDTTTGFGSSISSDDGSYLAVGAATSNNNSGQIYIYNYDPLASNAYQTKQILALHGQPANRYFGSTVEMSDDGKWLYAAVPGLDIIKAYNLRNADAPQVHIVNTNTLNVSPSFSMPFIIDDIDGILIRNDTGRYYVPYIDYVTIGNTIQFLSPMDYPLSGEIEITFEKQDTYFSHVADIPAPHLDDINAVYSMSVTNTGSELIIGAPMKYSKGEVISYDRSIEILYAYDNQFLFYVTPGFDPNHLRIYNADVELSKDDYTTDSVLGEIHFSNNFNEGTQLRFETNRFNVLQEFKPPIEHAHDNDLYGYAVTVCPLNCSLAIGMPNFDNTNEQTDTGIVYQYLNQSRRFGTIKGTVQDPIISFNGSIRINNVTVNFTDIFLSTIISDINDLNLAGITAKDEDGYLVITSDSKLTIDKLIISPGSDGNSALTELGLVPYPLAQEIKSPIIGVSNERFGEALAISRDAGSLIVGSSTSSSKILTKFDDDKLTFDSDSTQYGRIIPESGSVTIFDYIPAINESINNLGSFIVGQQLSGEGLNENDLFGKSIAVTPTTIVVGSPGDINNDIQTGTTYTFLNESGNNVWHIIRSQHKQIETKAINRIFLFSKETNNIITILDHINPVKGKILGHAAQEIDFRTQFDPAKYTNSDSTVENFYWASSQIGRVWWDLSTIRYLDYEQDTTQYKASAWGKIFPGSSVDIYEWVETDVHPSAYVAAGYDGIPKDEINYTLIERINRITGLTDSLYYYWVKDKIEVDTVKSPFRTMTTTQVEQFITNPKGQGIPYAEIIDQSSIILINSTDYLSDDDILLHVDYDVQLNHDVIHSEYTLIQEGGLTNIPAKTLNKIIDSLAGIDKQSQAVPDVNLPLSKQYGLSIRPRQSMFVHRSEAVRTTVLSVNQILAEHRILDLRDMPSMYDSEAMPSVSSGEYDIVVPTVEEMNLIDITGLSEGYKVMVELDSNTDALWVIYKLENNEWVPSRVQAYDVTRYWSAIDWYADGYDSTTTVDLTLQTRLGLHQLQDPQIDTIIKIVNNGNDQWELVRVIEDGLEVIGVQNSTIELSDKLYDPKYGAGYGSTSYDLGRWDQSPQEETRKIIDSVLNEILIDEFTVRRNELFFGIVRYVLAEQKAVDWIFKTSFISVNHAFDKLEQSTIYQKENQDYLKDYINEVKPYRTKVREYLIDYRKLETWEGDVTDFDIPAYYDFNLNRFRSPNGEQTEDEEILSTQIEYDQWYNNHTYSVSHITVENPGWGYDDSTPPVITVLNENTGSGLEAVARVVSGEITGIDVLNPGSGYTETPTIKFATGSGSGAKGYVHLTNSTVRKIKTTMKFDRITYGTVIVDWVPQTNYEEGDIIFYNNAAFRVLSDYESGINFTANNLELIPAEDFDNANDRTWAYYQPLPGMIGKDLNQLFTGMAFAGQEVTGPTFPAGYGIIGYGNGGYSFETDSLGIDTITDGGALDTNFTGIRPGEIDIDGGKFIDTYHTYSPEELIPGRVFETLDMQVYTLIGSDFEGNGANTKTSFRSYGGDGIITDFTYAPVSDIDTDVLFVYLYNSDEQKEGIDYTVDRINKIISFNTPPANGDQIMIFITDHVGTGLLSNNIFEGDGSTINFDVNVETSILTTTFITVDGIKVDHFATAGPTPHITSFELLTPPAIGQIIHIRTFIHDPIITGVSEIRSLEHTVTGPADTTIVFDSQFGTSGPFASKLVVEHNGLRLNPPNVSYWKGDGGRTEWRTPKLLLGTAPGSIVPSDIQVYIDGVEIIPGFWTLDATLGSDVDSRGITLLNPAPLDSEITIELSTESDYTVAMPNQILIEPSVTLAANDIIRILSWGNHDPRLMRTQMYLPSGTDVYMPYPTVLPEGYDVSAFDTVSMDGPIEGPPIGIYTNPSYLWVTLNGKRLFPNTDFNIDPITSIMNILIPVIAGDILVVTSFTENLQNPALAYRMFQDISGNVEFLRMADENSTRVTAEVQPDATYIELEDISKLAIPNISEVQPGVVFIDGERIIYYGRGATGPTHPSHPNMPANSIWQLARATHGTSMSQLIEVGKRAVDGSLRQVVPETINTRIDTVQEPWVIWNNVVNTNAELNALSLNEYIPGAKVLVMQPDDINHTQEVQKVSLVPVSIQSDVEPVGVIGDYWWDTINNLLYIFNGIVWDQIGTEDLEYIPEWTLYAVYSDKVWYDQGIASFGNPATATNGTGLQSATTVQALFLKDRPGFIPD